MISNRLHLSFTKKLVKVEPGEELALCATEVLPQQTMSPILIKDDSYGDGCGMSVPNIVPEFRPPCFTSPKWQHSWERCEN
nr:expressed protein [Hymenolepis microstoma]